MDGTRISGHFSLFCDLKLVFDHGDFGATRAAADAAAPGRRSARSGQRILQVFRSGLDIISWLPGIPDLRSRSRERSVFRPNRDRQTMATDSQKAGIEAIMGAARQAAARGPPPVHLWDPPHCGDIDMRIAADGTWFYQKTPIGRPALVKLFASVLKREGDKHYLVTPVEKCGITVDDAPFLAVEMRVERTAAGRTLHFRTNVDDWVACGPDHPLRFEPEVGT